jgi:hypothetical protein
MKKEVWYEFVWLPTFERTAKKLLTQEDRREIERTLCEEVGAGSRIRGTGGFMKLRLGLRAGKSGGARIIYFPDMPCERVYMVLAYGKPKKDSLTDEEKAELKKLANILKNEAC